MPKIVDRQQVRESLLVRAFDHFAVHGFHGATMRSLSEHLRVTTGTLYHYFRGKEDLFAQMLLHMAENDARQLESRVAPSATMRDRFRALIRFVEWKRRYFQKALFLFIDVYRFRARADSADGGRIGRVFPEALVIYTRALDRLFDGLSRRGVEGMLSFLIGSVALGLIRPGAGTSDGSSSTEFFETWIAAHGGEAVR